MPDTSSYDYTFQAKPFLYMRAEPGIDLRTYDYTINAKPFVAICSGLLMSRSGSISAGLANTQSRTIDIHYSDIEELGLSSINNRIVEYYKLDNTDFGFECESSIGYHSDMRKKLVSKIDPPYDIKSSIKPPSLLVTKVR